MAGSARGVVHRLQPAPLIPQRGQAARALFYRDHNGNEVDLLYPEGPDLVPLEIKSARTFSDNFAKGNRYFQKISCSKARGIVA